MKFKKKSNFDFQSSCDKFIFINLYSRTLIQNHLVPQEFVAVNDSFGESGTPAQLMDKYKLNNQAIVEAAEKVISRK
jgi:transketolase